MMRSAQNTSSVVLFYFESGADTDEPLPYIYRGMTLPTGFGANPFVAQTNGCHVNRRSDYSNRYTDRASPPYNEAWNSLPSHSLPAALTCSRMTR